ncbi:MAG: ABC transporter transmembrane domain-containing protein, partial [Chloroflexota bacterium]
MTAHADHDEDEILGKAYDGRLVRRLLPYLRPYRSKILLALVFLFATGVLDLAGPYLTKIAVDRYMTPHHPGGLIGILLLYLGALTLGFAARYGQNWYMQYVGQRVMFDLRNELFGHLQRLPLSFYDR